MTFLSASTVIDVGRAATGTTSFPAPLWRRDRACCEGGGCSKKQRITRDVRVQEVKRKKREEEGRRGRVFYGGGGMGRSTAGNSAQQGVSGFAGSQTATPAGLPAQLSAAGRWSTAAVLPSGRSSGDCAHMPCHPPTSAVYICSIKGDSVVCGQVAQCNTHATTGLYEDAYASRGFADTQGCCCSHLGWALKTPL
jgi:hypothetical protein